MLTSCRVAACGSPGIWRERGVSSTPCSGSAASLPPHFSRNYKGLCKSAMRSGHTVSPALASLTTRRPAGSSCPPPPGERTPGCACTYLPPVVQLYRGHWLYSAAVGDGVKGGWANIRRGPGGLGRFRTVSSRRILEGFLTFTPPALQCGRKPAESEPTKGEEGRPRAWPRDCVAAWQRGSRTGTTDGPGVWTRHCRLSLVACSRATALAREISAGVAGPAAGFSPAAVVRRTVGDSRSGRSRGDASPSIGHAAPPRFACMSPRRCGRFPKG